MKVLHVVPSYIPAFRYGGPIKAVHGLCKTLAKKGLDVTVFTTDIGSEKTLGVPSNKMVNIEGVKVFYYPVAFVKPYCYSKDLSRAIKRRIQEFNIVHIHSVYLYPTRIAAYWCRRQGIPYIINPFGALDMASIRSKGYMKKMIYINLIERHNINKAEFIHAASLCEREKLLSFRFNSPVITIPRGIELEDYTRYYDERWLIKRYPRLKGKKIILFLGRIHRKKGFDLLGPAFKKVIERRGDIHLVIAGPDEKGYVRRVKKIFASLKLSNYVLFTGMLLGNEKISAFYSSDIFILSSYGENFGIAVLEAMACKKPVVITDRVGLYPDVKEYKTGIVTDCDSDKIARAILTLLDNEDLKKSMGENGRQLVKDRFTSDKEADKMINIYEGIAKKNKA